MRACALIDCRRSRGLCLGSLGLRREAGEHRRRQERVREGEEEGGFVVLLFFVWFCVVRAKGALGVRRARGFVEVRAVQENKINNDQSKFLDKIKFQLIQLDTLQL